jgi:hypothetical protein
VPVQLTPVVQAMECLERILGIPEDGRPSSKANLDVSMIERALDESAHLIADECEQRLAELAVAILEDPNYRLASAEEALRQFSILVEQSLKSQETLARELNENGAQLYKRIQKLIDSYVPAPGATSSQWTLVAKKTANGSQPPNTPEIIDLVRNYTKVRFHSLVLTHLNRLYLGLRGHLSDQVREVGFCRARIGELQALLVPPAIADKHATGPADCSLFPPGCVDLKEAIEQLSTTINTEDLLAFDHRIQVWIKEHCRALLEICMGSSTTVKNLAPAMLQEAEAYLGDRLQGVSVTEMYLTRKQAEYEADTADDMIFDDLQRYLDNATPDIGRPTDDSEITVISLPNDEYGQHLEKLLSKKLTNVKILLTDAPDEMLFYHEVVNIQWKDLEQFGPIAAEAYHQRCVADPATLHTREDVFDWQLIAESR